MIKKYIMVCCVIVSLLGIPAKADTDKPTYEVFMYEAVFTTKDYIVHFADVYNAPQQELLSVAKCESNFRQSAVGDNGTSFGTYQYKVQTFKRYAKLMGEELDINSTHDQAKVTAFIFKNYPKEKQAWTCYRKINN